MLALVDLNSSNKSNQGQGPKYKVHVSFLRKAKITCSWSKI